MSTGKLYAQNNIFKKKNSKYEILNDLYSGLNFHLWGTGGLLEGVLASAFFNFSHFHLVLPPYKSFLRPWKYFAK